MIFNKMLIKSWRSISTVVCYLVGIFLVSSLMSCSSWLGGLKDSSKEELEDVVKVEKNDSSKTQSKFQHGDRATKDDFIDQSQEAGSLWASSGQTNYFFTKNKIRSPGDIITLILEDELYRQIGTEIKNNLNENEQITEINLLRDEVKQQLMGRSSSASSSSLVQKDVIATSAAALKKNNTVNSVVAGAEPPPTAVSGNAPVMELEEIEREIAKQGIAEVDIFRALDLKVGDKMMGEIIHRYPNGNYQIRTTRKVPYKRGQFKTVTVVAVVKAADVAEETDIVQSSKLYETQVDAHI